MRHRLAGMRHRLATVVLCGLALAVGGCSQDSPTAPEGSVQIQTDLNIARTATARYQDVAVALQDGFVADAFCVRSPAGTMGFHYLNPGRMDSRLNPAEPEILLYVREGGQMRLAGIEYWVPIVENGQPYFGAAPPANPGSTPRMFGETFQGPMPGHSPTMPWHYDLHVWIWQANPAGMFSQFNPSITCS